MLECAEILPVASDAEIRACAVKGGCRLDGTIPSMTAAMVFPIAAEIGRGLISARTGQALRVEKAIGLPLMRPKYPSKNRLDHYCPEIKSPVV